MHGSISSVGACFIVAAWLGLAACGAPPEAPAEGSSTTEPATATTADSTEGPGMSGPVSTGSGTTAGTSLGTADDTTGEPAACGDPPRGLACEPPGPATTGWQLHIDGAELVRGEATGACTVIDVTDDGVTATVALDCTRFLAEIDLITMNPHHVPDLAPDDPVELMASAFQEDEAVVARYLTLRRGGLTLAAFDASTFSPPPGFDFDPVALEVVPTDCPLQPTECVYKQDAALQIDFDGQTEQLYQGQEALVGQLTSYRVITGRVERAHCFPDDCGYNYAEWFVQGLLFRIPEG